MKDKYLILCDGVMDSLVVGEVVDAGVIFASSVANAAASEGCVSYATERLTPNSTYCATSF